jgi:hypothetical protein
LFTGKGGGRLTQCTHCAHSSQAGLVWGDGATEWGGPWPRAAQGLVAAQDDTVTRQVGQPYPRHPDDVRVWEVVQSMGRAYPMLIGQDVAAAAAASAAPAKALAPDASKGLSAVSGCASAALTGGAGLPGLVAGSSGAAGAAASLAGASTGGGRVGPSPAPLTCDAAGAAEVFSIPLDAAAKLGPEQAGQRAGNGSGSGSAGDVYGGVPSAGNVGHRNGPEGADNDGDIDGGGGGRPTATPLPPRRLPGLPGYVARPRGKDPLTLLDTWLRMVGGPWTNPLMCLASAGGDACDESMLVLVSCVHDCGLDRSEP